MFRKIIRILLVVSLVIGALFAGLVGFVTSAAGSRLISRRLDESLEKQTGLSVAFANIDINIFPPRLIVRDLQISDSAGRLNCTVAESEISPDPIDLLGGTLSVEEIYLGSPVCTVNLDMESLEKLFKRRRTLVSDAEELDLSLVPDAVLTAGVKPEDSGRQRPAPPTPGCKSRSQ